MVRSQRAKVQQGEERRKLEKERTRKRQAAIEAWLREEEEDSPPGTTTALECEHDALDVAKVAATQLLEDYLDHEVVPLVDARDSSGPIGRHWEDGGHWGSPRLT